MRIQYLPIVPLLLKMISKGYFGLPVFEIIPQFKLLDRLLLYVISICMLYKKVVSIIIKKYVYYTYFLMIESCTSSEIWNLWT
jgi:hypothetical protein